MPDKYYTIIYENLVTNTENVMKGLCEFVNIPYNAKMIESAFPEWLSEHLERRGDLKKEDTVHKGLLSPINTTNIGKWKNNMSPYNQLAVEIITADFAGKMYGYDINIDYSKGNIPLIRILKAKLKYYAWQMFTQLKYKSFRFNLMYTERKQRKWGKNMSIAEYF